ncbi:MAG: choice-of-anchor J domain-containing protein [Candidatus Latescibacteria bacterium]|nr:choice-of-anchor J domain-containing protein [Candidatus Latescibacterota bacterium]
MKRAVLVLLVIGLASVFAMPYQSPSKYDADNRFNHDPFPHAFSKHLPRTSSAKNSVIFAESFDGATFPPINWSRTQTNTGMNGVYPCYWDLFDTLDYFYSAPGAAGLWWSYAHQDEWLISPEITLTGSSTNRYYLKYWYYGHHGPNDSAHYYTKISTDGGTTWTNIYDLTNQLIVAWNRYVEPLELNLSAYANQTIKIAWHATDGPADAGIPFAWMIDDIEVGFPYDNDMGVATLNAIQTVPVVVNDPDTFFLTVRNYGTSPQTNVPVLMTVDDVIIDQVNISVDTLGSVDTFLVWTPSIAGDYTIKFFTQLATDQDMTNDTLFKEITVCPEFHSVPYVKDFNEDWGPFGDNPPFCGWSIVDNGSENPKEWNHNDWFHAHTGAPSRSVAAVKYNPVEHQNEWLISPRLDCSVDTQYTLSYWNHYEAYLNALPDFGYVLVSNDDGLTWHEVARYVGGVSEIISLGYQNHDISALVRTRDSVRVAFRYQAFNAGKWMIDDFTVMYRPGIDVAPVFITNMNLDIADTIRFDVKVQVQNTGLTPLSPNWFVYFEIRDRLDSLAITSTLNPSDTMSVIFHTYVTAPDTYTVCAWTAYPGDEYLLNNKISKKIRISGWKQLANMPSLKQRKFVKDGGSLVVYGDLFYAFRGNNSCEFYVYDPPTDVWDTLEPIPWLKKDSVKYLKKNVKNGGDLTVYGDKIYAFKGGNTKEFWANIPANDTWIQMSDIPFRSPEMKKKVKGGGSLVTCGDKIYAFKGGKTTEFWMYDPATDSWAERCSLKSVDNRMVKPGAALEEMNGLIYAFIGGNTSFFYAYSPTLNAWNNLAHASFDNPNQPRKKRIKDGADLVAMNGKLYAFKGGNTHLFGYYVPEEDTWYHADPIPGPKKVKTGGSLIAYDGKIYALKGNNTGELWSYQSLAGLEPYRVVAQSTITPVQTEKIVNNSFAIEVAPNPLNKLATIRYTILTSGKVSIKLYNASGRLVETLLDNTMTAGTYSMNLNANKLAKGVYFLKYEVNNSKSELKLIVQ